MPGVTTRDDVTISIGRLNCKSMRLLKGSPRCSHRKTERRTEHAQFLQTQITAHDGDLMMTTPKYIGPGRLDRPAVPMEGRGHRPYDPPLGYTEAVENYLRPSSAPRCVGQRRIEPALPRSVF